VLRVTGSAGVAAAAELGEAASVDALLALADERLYQAKAAGRNCVVP
jgi:GGDEF domain-containing protein